LKIEAASRVGLTGLSSRSNEALDLIGNTKFLKLLQIAGKVTKEMNVNHEETHHGICQ